MVQLVRHRQTKGSATDRLNLNHRVTPRLHRSAGRHSRLISLVRFRRLTRLLFVPDSDELGRGTVPWGVKKNEHMLSNHGCICASDLGNFAFRRNLRSSWFLAASAAVGADCGV